jgi:copper chaperone
MTRQLSIEGMTCGHCVARVKKALSEVPGVARAEVDLGKKLAVVEGAVLDDTLLGAAVADAGYEVVAVA